MLFHLAVKLAVFIMHMAKAVTVPAAEPNERHVKNTRSQESFGSQVEHFKMYKGGSEPDRNKDECECVVWCVKDPFGS